MSAPLKFRPHHFLCALGFEGKGYSSGFIANMSGIVDGQLRGPQGDETVIEVVRDADAICAPCPQRIGAGCAKQDRITALDDAHADALRLTGGDRLTWGEAQVPRSERPLTPASCAQVRLS